MQDKIISISTAKPSNKFSGLICERLSKARKAKYLNQTELANLVGLTRQSISAFEQGIRSPDGDTLFRLAKELDQPISFFIGDAPEGFGPLSPRFFRAFGRDSKKRNDQCTVYSEWISSIVGFFSKKVNFPNLVLPGITPSSSHFYNNNEIEDAATNIRRKWDLGDGPIGNLTALLESKGIIVSSFPISDGKIDAFSFWSGDIPFIILDSNDLTAVRARFNLAHELGHLVLHSGIDESQLEDEKFLKKIEAEANRFASSFLLPSRTFANEIFSSRLEAFIELKRRWKVSISAQIYRCSDLEILTELQVLNLYKQISARKMKIKEPLDDILEIETPTLLKKTVDLLTKNSVYSQSEMLNSINIGYKFIKNFCNLPENWFSQSSEIQANPTLKNG